MYYRLYRFKAGKIHVRTNYPEPYRVVKSTRCGYPIDELAEYIDSYSVEQIKAMTDSKLCGNCKRYVK